MTLAYDPRPQWGRGLGIMARAAIVGVFALLLSVTMLGTLSMPQQANAWRKGTPTANCAGLPTAAVNAGLCLVTLDVNGANGDFSTSKVDQSHTYASGFLLYHDQCQGQNGATGASHTTLNGSSATVGNGSLAYQAELATATCKAPNGSGFVGTAFAGATYFEVLGSFTGQSCSGWGCNNGWEAILWTFDLEPESKDGGMATPVVSSGAFSGYWAGQGTKLFAGEFDVNEYFEGQFSNSLNNYSETSHWHSSNGTGLNDQGEQAQNVVAYGQSNFATDTTYWGLYTPATASTSGSFCYGHNTTQDHCDTWTQMVPSVQVPPANGQSWRWGFTDNHHFTIYMGCDNSNKCTVKRLRVIQATAVNNINA